MRIAKVEINDSCHEIKDYYILQTKDQENKSESAKTGDNGRKKLPNQKD